MEVRSKISKFRDFLLGGERFVTAHKLSVGRGAVFVRGVCHGDYPPPYGNVRAVRILMECILVLEFSVTSHNQTRMHSSRMCTARSSGRPRGCLHQAPPRAEPPREQTPPGADTPQQTPPRPDTTPQQTPPPRTRHPPC